jgi:sec-independent protein translocase protein TatB
MFDIGWSELLVIGVVALIAIGPKELPGVLRSMGHWMGKVRRMASEFQDQFREAMREAEVADLKRQFDEASASATSAFNNPLETAQKEVEEAFASADPAKITTSDPGAIEPPASPALPEASVAPAEVPAAPAQPAETKAETKPGGSA